MTAPKTCPECGAHLDACEECDCRAERGTAPAFVEKEITKAQGNALGAEIPYIPPTQKIMDALERAELQKEEDL